MSGEESAWRYKSRRIMEQSRRPASPARGVDVTGRGKGRRRARIRQVGKVQGLVQRLVWVQLKVVSGGFGGVQDEAYRLWHCSKVLGENGQLEGPGCLVC